MRNCASNFTQLTLDDFLSTHIKYIISSISYSKCRDLDPGKIYSPSRQLVSFTTSTVSLASFRTAHIMQIVAILKTNNSNIGLYRTSMQVFMEIALRLSDFNHNRKVFTNFIKNPKYEISRKIRPVQVPLFHENGRKSGPHRAILIISENSLLNLHSTTNFQAKGSRGGGGGIYKPT